MNGHEQSLKHTTARHLFATFGKNYIRYSLPKTFTRVKWHAGGVSMVNALANTLRQRAAYIARRITMRKMSDGYKYRLFNRRVYCPTVGARTWRKHILFFCTEIYFKHYLPSGDDVVMDFGAGLGEEVLWLKMQDGSENVRYIAFEASPVTAYFLLRNVGRIHNVYCSGATVSTVPLSITNLASTGGSYLSDNVIPLNAERGGWIVPIINLAPLLATLGVSDIALLKMNVEGAEADILKSCGILHRVRRAIISVHDFRADRGQEGSFRTKQMVLNIMLQSGFRVEAFSGGPDWHDSWLFFYR